MGSDWSLEVTTLELPLAERFTIARQSWDSTDSVIVRLSYRDGFGVGECQPAERWNESIDATVDALRNVDVKSFGVPEQLDVLDEVLPAGAARAALDLAMHDLAAKRAGQTVRAFLNVTAEPPPTSMTVWITDEDAMLARVSRLRDAPIIKAKVGFEGDVEIIAKIRNVYANALRIDANEGWEPDEAIEKLQQLERFDIELCEQPIPGGRYEELARVSASTSIPVLADEDALTAEDVSDLRGKVDGVNLKINKTGGLREAMKAVGIARELGMRTMLGCNLESGIGLSAGAQIAGEFDHVDLDSVTFLARDPFPSVSYDRGRLVLPAGPGLGVDIDPRDVVGTA